MFNFRENLTSLVSGAVLAGSLMIPGVAASEIVLKVADTFPPGHYIVKEGVEFWIKRVEELTDGEVKIQYFGAGQLGKLRDMFTLTQNGVTDIGYVPPAFNGGTMPLSGVHSLPSLFSSSSVGSPAFLDTVNSTAILQNDYLDNGMRPLWGIMTSTYNLFTRGVEVNGVEDMKGLKLKAVAGNMSQAIELLGGSPVDIPSPETYQSIRTGTVDGAIFPATSVYSYKLNEVVDTAVLGIDMFVYYAPFVINEEKWQSLPVNVQEALVQAGQEAMERVAAYTDVKVVELEKTLVEDGIKVIKLNPEQQTELRATISVVADNWVADMESKGLPGGEVLEAFKANIAERSK